MEKVFPKVLNKWENHKEMVLEIIEDIRERPYIQSPIAYVEYMLNSKLKENLNQGIQANSLICTDSDLEVKKDNRCNN